MFSNSNFSNRKGGKSQSHRERSMQIETLESRELLTVSPVFPDAFADMPAIIAPMLEPDSLPPKHELVVDLSNVDTSISKPTQRDEVTARYNSNVENAILTDIMSEYFAYASLDEEITESSLGYSQEFASYASSDGGHPLLTKDITSEIMIGNVYVTVVLLESNGQVDPSTENWDSYRIGQVKDQISQGLKWWEDTFDKYFPNSPIDLKFQIDFTYADTPFETVYEPINHPYSNDILWVSEFLVSQGYEGGSTQYKVHSSLNQYNHDMRVAHNCDWAYTIFVADSLIDVDGMFNDGNGNGSNHFGYAFFGGPRIQLTYDNDGWGIEDMRMVLAHETGHIFFAADEYDVATSYGSGGTTWTDTSGYYGVQNLNAWDSPYGYNDSLMAESGRQRRAYNKHMSSQSSLEMIGWRDSDGDGLIDYLDQPLTLANAKGTWDSKTSTFRFTGNSAVTCAKNHISGSNDHTLNTVDILRYKIDDGSWQIAQTWSNSISVNINSTVNLSVSTGSHKITFQTYCSRTGVASEEFTYNFTNPNLAVPTLNVKVNGSDSCAVSIGSVPFATRYQLEYSTNPNFTGATILNVEENSRNFTIDGLRTNTEYYFRVKAIGTGQYADSPYSEVRSIKIIKLLAPTLDVSPISGTSSVYITVGSVEHASGYALEYSTDSKFTVSTITSVPEGTSTIGGLAPNTKYYFRVKALGTGTYADSEYSAVKSIITDRIKLLTPRLEVSPIDSYSISVNISKIEHSTGYVLEYSKDSNFSVSTTLNPDSGPIIIDSLDPNTKYYFRVMALGNGDYTNSNISTTKSATTYAIKLDVPTLNVIATNVDSVSVTIDGVENASGYKLEYSKDSKFTSTTTEIVQAGDTLVTGLSAKTTYYFRISAIGTGFYANSDYSPTQSARTYAAMVIDNVGDSISTAKEITFTNDYFTFTDKVGSGEYRLKEVDIYKLTVSSSDVGKNYTFTTFQPAGGTRVDTVLRLFDSSGKQLEFTDDAENDFWYSSLTWTPSGAGTYYLGVSSYLTKDYDPAIAGSASISGDQGDYTLTITRAEAVIKLNAPTISVSANDSDSVAITVSNVENASEYSLQYATNSNFTDATSANIQVGTNSIAGLTANTKYYFRVMALGLGNYSNSDYSATKSIKTSSAVVKLDAPTLSFNGNVYSDSISITVGTVANASEYFLQYSTDSNFTNATSAPIQAGVNTITGLIANTTYYFRVMALGEGDYSNSDYSAIKSITTNEKSAIDKVGDSLASAKDVSFTDNTFIFTNSLGEGEYGLKNVDIYKLVVSDSDVGGKYTFTTSQPAGGTRVDTFIRLFNSSGAQLSYNDDGGGASYSSLAWSPTSAGVYYLGVSSYLNKGYDPAIAGSASTNGTKGDYTLTVTRAEKSVKLAAPTLNVNTIGSDSVSVTVGSVTNASEYTLQYSTNSRFTNAVSKSVSSGTTNITGLNENTSYYFRVLASGTDRFVNSDYSVSQIAKTNQSAKLDIAINDNRVTLSWNDSNPDADAVRYRIAGTTRWATSKLKAGVTTYTFSGAFGANYEIEVLLDQQENSVLSGSAVVLDQAKLSAVKNEIKDDTFQVNVTNYTAKNLSSNAHQAIVTINGVKTTLDIVNQQGSKNISGGGKISFSNGLFTFTEMKSATSYKVQISFSDSVSISKVSSALTVKTTKTCYQTPNLVSATAVSDTSITVTWQTSYGKNSNTAAQKYTIQYSTDGVKWSNATTGATGNSYTIQRLKGGVEYQVRVLATKDNAFDASSPSAVLTAETLTLPKIALEKNSVKDDTFQLNVTNYQNTNLPKATTVNVKSDKFGSTTINLLNGSGSASFANGMTASFNNGALTFANVPSNTQQKIQLSFSKGVCTTAWSSALTVKTLVAPYNKPVLTNAVAVSSTSIKVSWETVYGKNSTSPAQKYTVQYSTDGVKWTNATTGATGTNFTITRLKANTKYLVAVIANKDSKFNVSQPSNSLLVTTLN